MRHIAHFATLLLSAGLLAAPASAQTAASTPAGTSANADPNLLDVTCGEFQQAVRAADAGPNPTTQRKAQAEAAIEALGDGIIWLHGYESGKVGVAAAPPLNKAYFTERVGQLVRACASRSPDGRMRLVDAASRP